MNQEQIIIEQNTLISRLFTLGGSVLFLIGSVLAVNVAVQSLQRALGEN